MPYYHNIFFLFFHQISVLSIFICLFILYVIISSFFPTFPILLLLLSLLYYLMHLFYLQEFLLDSHQPLHIHLSFTVLTQLNPGTVSPKREKLFYICSLSARIECEPEGEHSTHSDRVTNIGCILSLRASVLSHKLNSYPCIFSIRRAVSSVNFFKELTIAAFCADNSSHCFFSSSTLRRLSS